MQLNPSTPGFSEGLPAVSKWSHLHDPFMAFNTPPLVSLDTPSRTATTPSGELFDIGVGKMITQPLHPQWQDSSNGTLKSQALVASQQQDMMLKTCLPLTKNGNDQEFKSMLNVECQDIAGTGSSASQPDNTSSELLSLIDIPPTDPLRDFNVIDIVGTVSESGMLPTNASPVKVAQSLTVLSGPVMTTGDHKTLIPRNTDVLSEFDHSFTAPTWSESTSAATSYSLVDENEYMQQTPMAPPQPPPSHCSDLHPDVPTLEVWAYTHVVNCVAKR